MLNNPDDQDPCRPAPRILIATNTTYVMWSWASRMHVHIIRDCMYSAHVCTDTHIPLSTFSMYVEVKCVRL